MNWNKPENQKLIKALLSLKTAQEVRCFVRDLLTEGEIEELAKRLKTAQMLTDKVPYSVIEKKTGFSSRTVARVSKWLNTGEGGYKKVLSNIHHNNESN